ncbi:MAG TPA: energy transducer TonB [Terriglobia bacterium]|nr:energy transducer TonB [Terriglobia bacterium]
MRAHLILWAGMIWLSAGPSHHASISSPKPDHFAVGRRTFFDFGPPFDYYELFVVHSTTSGSLVERITLSPPGSTCNDVPKLETASAYLQQSVRDLLGRANPCSVPERAVNRELKRRKKGPVFSGAEAVLQVNCGTQTRLLRSDVLDRDMFDAAAGTPQYTSWTMHLLQTLNQALPPDVMQKPIFPSLEEQTRPTTVSDSPVLRDMGEGGYDALFPGGTETLSGLYRGALQSAPTPSVRLISSTPVSPVVFVAPKYPGIAVLARVEGIVSFEIEIDSQGTPGNLTFESGSPLLEGAVRAAASTWKFPEGAAASSRAYDRVRFELR